MQKYDQIVVGGGIGGLTLAALLGLNGRKVLLLEKGPRIGGSMLRFARRGIPFDTGFHFTGGFANGGILADMLATLGIADAIRPDIIRDRRDNRFVYEDSGQDFALPVNRKDLVGALKSYFPGEDIAIDRYFAMIDRVCENSMSMNLRAILNDAQMFADSGITLEAVLNDLTANRELQSLLAGYATCYGVPASEVSFADHSRVSHGLYQSVARVQRGGEAFTDALSQVLKQLNVEICCSTSLAECSEIRDRRVGRFVLSSGDEVLADDCIFTIHPRKILEVIPRAHLHKAFVDRIEAFEPSIGFFCVYGVVRDGGADGAFSPAMISLLPCSNMSDLLRRNAVDDRIAVIMMNHEKTASASHNVVTVLEASEPADVAEWADSVTGRRPAGYHAYKKARCDRLMERVRKICPEIHARIEVLETASMLTFRDYLHSPWGCAYGVRQKAGQFSLFGRLPLRNIHAAGQSAMLPGLVGSMMASFVLARRLIGREAFSALLERQSRNHHSGGVQ